MNHGKLFVRKFNMNEGQHHKLTIWRCYHDENQIQRYHMYEDENVFLFNSKNDGYLGRNLNYMNAFFCEGVCLLYPYLNNLKSNLIGFQHYRRIFNYKDNVLKIDDMRSGKYQYFFNHMDMFSTLEYRIYSHCELWRMIDCGMYDDIMEYLQKRYPQLLNQPPRDNGMVNFNMFVCTWDKYVELAKFLYGYIKFLNDKYELGFDEWKWAQHVEKKFIFYNRDNNIPPSEMPWEDLWGKNEWYTTPYWCDDIFKYAMYRVYSFNIEFLTSCWIRYHDNVYDPDNQYKFI